jgi:thiol-disulfide isomerase/thioredoxin
MNENKKTDPRLLIAMILVAVGLLAIGVMFMMKTYSQTSNVYVSSDLSAVPSEMDYPAPKLNLMTLDGSPVFLEDFRDRIVLVNLWATWCPPCRQEMPILNAFYEQYEDQGFVLISIDQEETREVVQPFVEEFGLSFPVWLDEDYLAQQAFKTVNLPSSYVIDRAGRVRLMWIGAISQEKLEQYVPKLIFEPVE